jgi:predicted XRE-type DNA-binding protein
LQGAVADVVANEELIATLRSQIDALPEFESQLLACCYGANMSHHEIAKSVGVSQPTVSNKIQQALERLRAGLTKVGVVAVVPLLSAKNLFEAITTGQDCPPGMTERVLNGIDSVRTKAARPRSRRFPAAQRGGSAIVPALAILAVGATVLWFGFQQRPATTKAPVSDAPRAPSVSPEPFKPVADEIIYEDHFTSKELNPFWVKANPPGQVRTRCGDIPMLTLLTGGPDLRVDGERLSPDVELVSRRVELSGRPVEIVLDFPEMKSVQPNPPRSTRIIELDGKSSGLVIDSLAEPSSPGTSEDVFELLDGAGSRLFLLNRTQGKPLTVYLGSETIGKILTGEWSRILVEPSGRIALSLAEDRGRYREVGSVSKRIQSVAIRIFDKVSGNATFDARIFKSIVVRRLAEWPKTAVDGNP